MGIRNLDKVFKPRRIALIGAGDGPSSLIDRVLANLLGGNSPRLVYPISPTRESIGGIPTYPDLARLPKSPDLAVVCARADAVPGVVQACGEHGIRGVLILSGGFRETGAEGEALEQRVLEAASRFDDLRIVGPNSLGVIAPRLGLNASHAIAMPQPGRLAFISQSRALSNAVLDWATDKGIGFSFFVSTGRMLDVGFGDLIDYFASDPETHAIILYLQSIEHARRFMSAARAFARIKPIVAYKAGRFIESAEVAASHTGSMVAEDAVYEAALQRAGVVRVTELDDVFYVAELLASQRLPKGSRLAILGNAEGLAVVAADALLAWGGELAKFSDETVERLAAVLPPLRRSPANPVDLLDGAPAERFGRAAEVVLADSHVDAALVIFATQAATDPTDAADAIVQVANRSRKPILAAWMGGNRVRKAIQVLGASNVPTHTSPGQAVRGFMHLVFYAKNLEALYETPRDLPVPFGLNRHKLGKILHPLLEQYPGHLTASQAETFLKAYEIPVYESRTARSADEAVEVAERVGYPVVLKVLSPQILHKVDVGGVALSLTRSDEVRSAYAQIMRGAKTSGIETVPEGVTVQKMARVQDGLEMILGAKKDPTFGAVIMVGIGGITSGLVQDSAVGLPPLNERLVRRMLESLRFWPMLQGYRGRPVVNLDRLTEVIIRFSFLIADYPEIKEFDINPLLVSAEEVVALDATVILDAESLEQPSKPYNHLAIRPYPEEYVRDASLADGIPVTFRPIRPEDEPLWHRLIASTAAESIRSRFRSLFKRATHAMAVQHCVIDYEREIAIVAEIHDKGARQLAGVAQLITDANHDTAEFAVLVSDPWQGKRLGGMLLDYCLEVAGRWGIERVVAEVDPDNLRMLSVLEKRGFRFEVHREEEVVFVEKSLSAAPEPAKTTTIPSLE